ncbi:uncharacterized protein LOC134221303 [Armigeres subalbatus]|uniref:uncharacterized protein LOC134221303 n=1 Tax=Armigeres subalbatus TaxID=124917 RepID=UPI002ED559C8
MFCPCLFEALLGDLFRLHLLGLDEHDVTRRENRYAMEFFSRAPHMKGSDVITYRNYVLKKGPFIDDIVAPDQPKNNQKAAAIRQEGSRFYRAKDFPTALEKYNESICWAEYEHLGIGYANRSAVYYEMGEYELCMLNIDLARKHNYPQTMLPKLQEREQNCKRNIFRLKSKLMEPYYKLTMEVSANPKRPFMADGIVQEHIAGYGRSMVAKRKFNIGDVILQEKAWLSAIHPDMKYKNCSHCSSENFHSLIPCPKCVSVMYCSKECMKKGWKFSHRFECGMTEKLHHVFDDSCRMIMAPKAFFYGLTLFQDNLKSMMSFSKTNRNSTNDDPFTLDYSSYDPLEEFKIFHKKKIPTDKFEHEDMCRFYAALYYSIYIKHPLVRSIFVTKEQKNFMLNSFLKYMRIIDFKVIGYRMFTTQLYSIASVCNHSCDPNTIAVTHFGQLKFIVTRPIAVDEQILISYGPLLRKHLKSERKYELECYHIDCLCDSCNDVKWRSMQVAAMKLPALPQRSLMILKKRVEDPNIDDQLKTNLLKDFVAQYAYAYPRDDYVQALDVYRDFLVKAFVAEVKNHSRVTAGQMA